MLLGIIYILNYIYLNKDNMNKCNTVYLKNFKNK